MLSSTLVVSVLYFFSALATVSRPSAASSGFCDVAHYRHAERLDTRMYMDEQVGDANAFAIPDLYRVSSFAHFDERATDSIAFGFKALSTSSSPITL